MRVIKPCRINLLVMFSVLFSSHGYANDEIRYLNFNTNIQSLNKTRVRDGTHVDLNNLVQLDVGNNQSEVADLLGQPVIIDENNNNTEWEYNIVIPLEGQTNHIVCQYKFVFNKQQNIVASQWRRAVCERLFAAATEPVLLATPEPPPAVGTESSTVPLNIDVAFSFNQYTLSESGKASLDNLAAKVVSQYHSPAITVTGYTDHIGASQYNIQLSEQRALSVKRYLAEKSIPADSIFTQAKGAKDPIVRCLEPQKGSKEIACLKPNRRVEVSVVEQGL